MSNLAQVLPISLHSKGENAVKNVLKNRLSRIAAAVAVSAATVAFAPLANAQGGTSAYRIGVEGHVPVICRVSVDAAQVSGAGTTSLGELKEFCNNAHGYKVVADYSPVLTGASLVVDGVEIPLNGSGSVIVSQSSTAAMANRKVELKLAGAAQPGSLTFRIQPL